MSRPYVVTISSEKGGVGKTTLATNLAIYLKAIAEDLPVTLLSFDNHFSVDRMFRIAKGTHPGDVADIFNGKDVSHLTQIGEFGIQFIPSSRDLSLLRQRLDSPDALARALAASSLDGVVILDTRPDLDIFTRNALFAADRVIVPVKDAPSLENCRHIYEFFDQQGLPRHAVKVLPCLIDQRIRYNGPFKNPYELMKAYAINRGYQCFDGFIAKSPKVESLNTNPEGRIYPILTHGENTEVHAQFAELARTVFRELLDSSGRRVDQIRDAEERKSDARRASFDERRRLLATECLVCGAPIVGAETIGAKGGFYVETSDGKTAGYLEGGCFADLVMQDIFGEQRQVDPGDPLYDLLRESAQRCYFVLRRAPHTRGFYQQQLSFYRFDENLLELSHKQIAFKEQEQSPLFRLASRTLLTSNNLLDDHFLLVRRVSTDFPEEILYDENYQRFLSAGTAIAGQLPV